MALSTLSSFYSFYSLPSPRHSGWATEKKSFFAASLTHLWNYVFYWNWNVEKQLVLEHFPFTFTFTFTLNDDRQYCNIEKNIEQNLNGHKTSLKKKSIYSIKISLQIPVEILSPWDNFIYQYSFYMYIIVTIFFSNIFKNYYIL